MDQKSQDKVLRAGFTIIRKDDVNGARIKQKTQTHNQWHTLQKYETKVSRDRAFEEFMKDDKIIND